MTRRQTIHACTVHTLALRNIPITVHGDYTMARVTDVGMTVNCRHSRNQQLAGRANLSQKETILAALNTPDSEPSVILVRMRLMMLLSSFRSPCHAACMFVVTTQEAPSHVRSAPVVVQIANKNRILRIETNVYATLYLHSRWLILL